MTAAAREMEIIIVVVALFVAFATRFSKHNRLFRHRKRRRFLRGSFLAPNADIRDATRVVE